MPRYFFHIRSADGLLEDPEGSELTDLAAAHVEARATVRDLLAELILAERVLDGQCVELTDDTGRMIASLPFRSAIRQH